MDLLARLGEPPALAALRGEDAVWIVGGAVRDLLLGRRPHELDFVVEGDAAAVARRAAARLGGRVTVHDRFGTATVEARNASFDLAAARRETYPRPGALPEVELGARLGDDLARRDFTVNTFALHLTDGRVQAWPGAREDLDAGVLRVLHDGSFDDDPTRLLRLARYAARLGFAPDRRTDALAAVPGRIATVTPSRVGAELRLLLREPQPDALVALARHGLGREVLGPSFHPDPDVIRRAVALTPADARPDLAALAATMAGAPDRRALAERLDALELPARDRDAVAAAATRAGWLADALAPGNETRAERLDPVGLWRMLRRTPPEAVAVAGALDPGGPAEAAARHWLDDVRTRRLAVTGDDYVALGLSGPPVGDALEAAHEAMLAGKALDAESQRAAGLRAVGAGRRTA